MLVLDALTYCLLRGSKLVIEATGTFTEEIVKGAYVNLQVKWGLITLIKTTADLCDQLKEVDESCPVDGDQVIRKEVEIPKEVPPVCLQEASYCLFIRNSQISREPTMFLGMSSQRTTKESPA